MALALSTRFALLATPAFSKPIVNPLLLVAALEIEETDTLRDGEARVDEVVVDSDTARLVCVGVDG